MDNGSAWDNPTRVASKLGHAIAHATWMNPAPCQASIESVVIVLDMLIGALVSALVQSSPYAIYGAAAP